MGFSKDFFWGAASASHQIEGAYLEDGKTLNIWDAFVEGHVARGDDGKVACDHYHRYKEDVALMKKIGLKSYRFSISWARIFPDDSGKINEKGLQFYKNLVNELIEAGIKPMCTLYHWDMPMWVFEKGGWEKEENIPYFVRYAEACVKELSDKIEYWLTFNEPEAFISAGYESGEHAPFLQLSGERVKAITRNVMLAHGRAVLAMRKAAARPIKIGTAHAACVTSPANETPEEIEKARVSTFETDRPYFCSWWADPVFLGKRQAGTNYLSDEDLKIIHQPLDFYAFNMYNADGYGAPKNQSNPRSYPGYPLTAMDWPITPECLYWGARFCYERYGLPIMITENGMANLDFIMLDGEVHDPQRIDYVHRHLLGLKRAADEGVPVIGYQYWSIMDNFEWALGYSRRFGLIYVDYPTQRRILKDSALFYAEVIKTNGENL
ncbi:MAG: family 1 glycosylhydrolase [Clostridia bacterium]|nr:family 1 glycosylhydrolase [Clostridia bacterium]